MHILNGYPYTIESPTTTSSSTTTSGVDPSNYSNTDTSSSATTNTDSSSSATTNTDSSSSATTNTDTSSSATTNTDTSSSATTNTDTSSSATTDTDTSSSATTNTDSSFSATTNNETSSQVPTSPSITNKDSSPPVEYIAAAIVAVILAIAGLIVMVIVIMACKRKRNSVKDKDFKGSDPDLYDSPKIKLSPSRDRLRVHLLQRQPLINLLKQMMIQVLHLYTVYACTLFSSCYEMSVFCVSPSIPGGVQATYAVVNKQKKKNRRKGNQSSNPPDIPQPYQQATPTESHDTAHDTYAVVDMTKKKKDDSHLDSEETLHQYLNTQLISSMSCPEEAKKKQEEKLTDEDTDAPPVPSCTMEEL